MRGVLVVLACLAAALAVPAPAPSPVVTPEQYEKSIKMLRNVCVPKTSMTEDLIERIKNGELVEERTANCYLACILTTTMVLKKGKIDGKMFRNQVKKMMTPEVAAKTIAGFDACEPEVPTQPDECDTVLGFMKCMKVKEPSFIPPA